MEYQQAADILTQADVGKAWLGRWGIRDLDRGHRILEAIAEAGVPTDLMASLLSQFEEQLPLTSDPDMALINFERFVKASRSPMSFAAYLDRDRTAFPILMQMLSSSQHLSDLLVRDPEGYDFLRITGGKPVARQALIDDVCSEVETADDERVVMAILRRFKHRETLRIAYGDIVGQQRVESITRQISYVADAISEAALRFAIRKMEQRFGKPLNKDGEAVGIVAIGLGKLGGNELNYSSDIDLIFVYDEVGSTNGERSRDNQEFFERVVRDFVKLLSENTDLGFCYRVDLRLRPNGKQGPIINTLENTWQYYDVSGRTWERQAYVKARAIAGDVTLGKRFLDRMESWVYRRYLSRADISGIKALKRRIEHRAVQDGVDERNVKTGRGGIRDIEFVIQFLQLLNGGDLEGIRTSNTLDAIIRLEQAGCLNMQERTLLEDNYSFLRKVEHRLQIMFDLQTHTLPTEDDELSRFAIRMGYSKNEPQTQLEQFKVELEERTEVNRKILDHLLHDAFPEDEEIEPEVDLILAPDPSEEYVHEIMSKYGFVDPKAAFQNLSALGNEKIPFLSTRRCRMFLASIAPSLLDSIAQTPDPDATLVSLSQVSDSLGGKGILWELFSFNPPSLSLYVSLCASSPYLSGILTSNPGMIDELMDSLVLDRLPTRPQLEETLSELSHSAEDLDPIIHSFKNSQHLRVGVRDILGKEDIQESHHALSDIAEVCLAKISQDELDQLVEKFGEPMGKDGEHAELIILALGKLGGREPNYHSDLDVVFLYDHDGNTKCRRAGGGTSNQHFFSQLAAKITKRVTNLGPFGRLYELDPRLRPTGRSGALAVSVDEFLKYFREGAGQGWERQALCKSRVVFASEANQDRMRGVVREAILSQEWSPQRAVDIYQMRYRLEETASKQNLKRGIGGTVDIEFLIQMLQLQHMETTPEVLVPGTLDAANQLRKHGFLSKDDAAFLTKSYRFLRSVESRLRLMNTTARHDLPEEPSQLKKLSYLLGYPGPDALVDDVADFRKENRERFERLFAEASQNVTISNSD